MWQRLSVLALCGMSALWADACDGLPTGPSFPQADPEPPQLSFRLSVKPGLPAFRITVRNSPFADIEVARCQDGRRLQLLPIMAGQPIIQPINFAATFSAYDINFDGYLDFSVLAEHGAKYGQSSIWVYDPGSGLFVQNELTQELSGLAGWLDFDPKKREIIVSINRALYMFLADPGGSCPAAYRALEGDRYRVENNRLIHSHQEEITVVPPSEPASDDAPQLHDPDPDHCTVTVSDLIGGTMRVTEVRRFDAQERSLK